MRRVMLLALSALALPTAALASTISFDTGPTFNANGNMFDGGFVAQVSGPKYTITILGNATLLLGSLDVFQLGPGTVTVTDTSTGATLFQGSIGIGTGSNNFGVEGSGSLEPSGTVKGGTFDFSVSPPLPGAISDASVAAITPEPSALEGLLLGTGMLGLAEVTRRKLRLGT